MKQFIVDHGQRRSRDKPGLLQHELPPDIVFGSTAYLGRDKPNVWAELHGWSPKYLTEPLRRDIARRLRDRVMFGADYPLFRYERLVADWKTLNFDEETLERVFYRNAETLFAPQLQTSQQPQPQPVQSVR